MSEYDQFAYNLRNPLAAFFPAYATSHDLGRGTAFPTTGYDGNAVVADDRFYRTDADLDCFYDGTRWLTRAEYPLTLTPFAINPLPFSGAGPSTVLLAALRTDYRAWYTRLSYYIFVNTLNNGTNFWGITVSDTGATGIWSPSTAAAAIGQSTGDTAAGVLGGSGASYVLAQLSKSGAPGTVSAIHLTVYYRLVIP